MAVVAPFASGTHRYTNTCWQIHSTVGFATILYMVVGIAGFAFTQCRGEDTTADNILTE